MAEAVCCGIVPHLELARRRELLGRPAVVAAGTSVLAASEEARASGVRPGVTVRQAEALCPGAVVVQPEPVAATRLADRLAAALYELAPAVEVRLDGRIWLELGGLPSAAGAVREARRRLRELTGADPRLGLAPGPFTAELAAARARPGRLVWVEDARAFLAPLPVGELRLSEEQLGRLSLLGLRTLGHLAAIGPRQLESQLGRAGRTAVLAALGAEPVPIRPWRPLAATAARCQLEPPVEDREALLFVARRLAGDLAVELGARGAGARKMRVRLGVEPPGRPEVREAVVRHPLSSAVELFGLVATWLREWKPAMGEAVGVTEIEIEVPETEAAAGRQLGLWTGGDGSAEEVDAALERLQERHGAEMALRAQPVLPASPIPEQRYALEPR